MLPLTLIWLALGAVLGLLARATGLWRATEGIGSRWWFAPLVGAVAAAAAGWAGFALIGRPLATCAALWVGVVAALAAPRVADALTRRE